MLSRIGKILKKYRKDNKLTQFQLAERIGVSEFYISAIETGKRKPGRDTLIKLSDEIKVPIGSLLELDTEQGVKYAAEELYSKINGLTNIQQKMIINIIETIVNEFTSNM